MARINPSGLLCFFGGVVMIAAGGIASGQTFQPQTRLAASLPGDTWEPSIAADRYGHLYALIPDSPPSCKKMSGRLQ